MIINDPKFGKVRMVSSEWFAILAIVLMFVSWLAHELGAEMVTAIAVTIAVLSGSRFLLSRCRNKECGSFKTETIVVSRRACNESEGSDKLSLFCPACNWSDAPKIKWHHDYLKDN